MDVVASVQTAIVSIRTDSIREAIAMAWLFWSIVAAAAILASLVVATNQRPGARRGSARRFGGPPAQHA